MENLILVPLDDSVLFPGMTATIAVETGEEERVLLRTPHRRRVRERRHRRRRRRAHAHPRGRLRRRRRGGRARRAGCRQHRRLREPARGGDRPRGPGAQRRARRVPSSASTARWSRRSSTCVERTRASVRSCAPSRGRGRWPTRRATRPTSACDDKIGLLETLDVTERLERALELQRERLAELQVRAKIRDDVQQGAERQQREYFLRKQMESIRKELGEDEGSVAEEYRRKIEEAGMPDPVREQAEKELGRLERMGDSSGESSMIRTYLDWLVVGAVVEALRGAARPRARTRGAGRRPRRPRGRQGPDHRVHRRAQAAHRARHDRGGRAPPARS